MTDPAVVGQSAPATRNTSSARVVSIDALRGFVMFMMIFVNDLHGGGKIVPNWMMHFSDRHSHGSGMTFVDVVFPAFLFVVGMSIPFSVGTRLDKGEPLWRVLWHVVTRTLALLFIGVLEVNEAPDSQFMGWSGDLWVRLMFGSAILAFCDVLPRGAGQDARNRWRIITLVLRLVGFAALIWLAFAFRGENGHRLIRLSPFHIHTSWWGILGLIGWTYLVASIVFLVFRLNRTALLGCMALLLCLYPADKLGLFDNFPLHDLIGFGETLGAHPSIAVGGLLLASILVAPGAGRPRSRLNFTILFVAGCAAGALLVAPLYGISKNDATPSWCLWCSAITAALWLSFHWVSDVAPKPRLIKPLATAGQNVLLAYLISEMLPSFASEFRQSLPGAIVAAVVCALFVLWISTSLNRIGFRVRI